MVKRLGKAFFNSQWIIRCVFKTCGDTFEGLPGKKIK